MSLTPGAVPPHELVRASAGTGKTFRISSRIVGLLAHGAEPDHVLASTFTRKAAGEILDRVLFRLAEAALDPDEARELDRHARFPDDGPGFRPLDPDRCLELLGRLVAHLHRVDVGTLDSLFNRMARSFTLELGMLPGWSVADDEAPRARALRSRAIGDVLADDDRGAVVEMLRGASRGEEGTRRIHDRLVRLVDDLQEVRHQIDPAATEPWAPFPADRSLPDDPDAVRRELAEELAEVEPPRNKSGGPDRNWEKALPKAEENLRQGDWEAFWGKGPGKNYLHGKEEYSSKPFPVEMLTILERARSLRAAELSRELNRKGRALGRLARLYDDALSARQREAGVYRFRDVTRRLAPGEDPVAGRPSLAHRMDRRAEHVLLDEFQDTNPSQWWALRPLVERGASGEGGAGYDRSEPSAGRERGGRTRATVVVADPKQSIYGWRGAEPGLVDRVGREFGLEEDRLTRSFRSSPVVLDFVNLLFRDVASNPVIGALDHGSEVADEWARSFDEHRPAPPREDDPGHVRVEAGPAGDSRSGHRPRLLARCAEEVAALHREAPDASIGVLTSTNRSVARLIHELRERGVDPGEEGGTPVDDAAPVAAVLSLLRMADHPDDRICRYHVAATPLGEILGYPDHTDDGDARRLARRVRGRLLRHGYGPTIAGWVRELAPRVDAAELRRLRQLVELGFRWRDRAGLRPDEFVRFARSERVADPREAAVQVMTVHQAKGLEFDVVFLSDLEGSLTGGGRGGETALPERDLETGRIRRVFPYVKTDLRPLVPEVEEAVRQHRTSEIRDALSWLYVAVTRAKHSLRLLVAGDGEGGPGTAKTPARVVRAALGCADEAVAEGDVLHERGDPRWFGEAARPPEDEEPEPTGAPPGAPAAAAEPGAEEGELSLRVDPERPRTRMLGRRSPSDLEGGDRVAASRLLRLDGTGTARLHGDVVHRWCQEVAWIEDGLPDEATLLRLGRDLAPELDENALEALARRFRRWMDVSAVREALSRRGAVDWAEGLGGREGPVVEVATERRLAFRRRDEVVTGVVDRLVLARAREGGPVVGARLLDFKTDDVAPDDPEALAERTALYRPQLRAYRRGIASVYGLEAEEVTARLLFLAPGVIREVD